MEKSAFIDIFNDMPKKDIKAAYNKTENAFNVAVNRMIKELENPDLKYKKDGEIWIAAKGVEWLDNYFTKPTDLSTNAEYAKLQERLKAYERENTLLQQQLEAQKEAFGAILEARTDQARLEERQTYLLEQKDAQNEREKLKEEVSTLRSENEKLKNRSLWERIINK